MKQHARMYDRLAQLSMLGNGTVPGVPLIEIISDKRVLIENHHGVFRYTHEQICVKSSLGIIQINGAFLHIRKMTKEQITVTGKIDAVILCRSLCDEN